MISFPREHGRLYAESATALAGGARYVSSGRSVPQAPRVLVLALRLPMSRRRITSTVDYEPVCGWPVFELVTRSLGAAPELRWAFLASPWGKPRVRAVGLDAQGHAQRSVVVEERAVTPRILPQDWISFRVPRDLRAFICQGWTVTETELLPAYHRPEPWNRRRLLTMTQEITARLEKDVARPPGTPPDYVPAHGDFVPWNVRRASGGRTFVIDWEDVCWAPAGADLVRFAVALQSMRRRRPGEAQAVRRRLPDDIDVAAAAGFWLAHRNLRADLTDHIGSLGRNADRTAREVRILAELAGR